MQLTTDRARLSGDASSERRSYDLVVVLGWLALFGVGLRVLVGWPVIPTLPAKIPSWADVQVWSQSPGASPAPMIAWLSALAWAIWLWTLASVLLRVGVDLAEYLTRDAPWIRWARGVSDALTLPLIRRAVDASLAGVLLVRVVASSGVAEARPLQSETLSIDAQPLDSAVEDLGVAGRHSVQPGAGTDRKATDHNDDVLYVVRPGDTLSGITLKFYGDPRQESRIFEANVGQLQPDGRRLNRHALILPNWALRIPGARSGVVEDQDGTRWYVVRRGDTLRGISADVLGDPDRYQEIFDLNVGTASLDDGIFVLSNPNLIWPGLRLRLPSDGESEAQGTEVGPVPDPTPAPVPPVEPSAPEPTASPAQLDAESSGADDAVDDRVTPEATPAAAPSPSAIDVESSELQAASYPEVPEPAPVFAPRPVAGRMLPGEAPLFGGGAAVAFVGAAGALLVRRRRRAQPPFGRENDLEIDDGFATSDPVEDLARRVAQTGDPPSIIASLVSQAYLRVFGEQLTVDQRREACEGVRLVSTRHGKSSTTLTVAAPVAARAHLIRHMRAAAESAFGEHVDVDGLVSQDGDVLVRLLWGSRHPVPARLLELVGADAGPALWPKPCLIDVLALYSRQELKVNWWTLSNLLIGAPTGQSAEIPLSALIASLASTRRPEDLGVILIARPHSLPAEIGRFPHILLDPVDVMDGDAVKQALLSVRDELSRRASLGEGEDIADLVLVVRELAELEPEAVELLGPILIQGPRHGVRVVAATERSVNDVLRVCPFLSDFGTRLVLQTSTEEESVALIGMPGAEHLGSGGDALLRLESRVPVQGWARQVPIEYLARLESLMGTRTSSENNVREAAGESEFNDAISLDDVPFDEVPVEDKSGERDQNHDDVPDEDAECKVDGLTPENRSVQAASEIVRCPGSELLQRLRSAPIRVKCFGGSSAWQGDRKLEISDMELLVLLAVHPVAGIRAVTLADMLWGDRTPSDYVRALRKRRARLREELTTAVGELARDPLPGEQGHGEKVVTLDPGVIASDVHEFVELLKYAPTLDGQQAIRVYEEALTLYGGDLLEGSGVPDYPWLYDGADIANTLRADYQRMEHEARLHVADLLAAGPGKEGLTRAAELYTGLCAENPDDERLWVSLLRVHERAGSLLGLQSAERRLRQWLVELSGFDEADVETVTLPPKLERVLQEIRARLSDPGRPR